ncbi:MAG: hypothetical protein OXC72_15810 [Roseovarius sp.]|nr:hypothetical protein [Roseovarius sp.]
MRRVSSETVAWFVEACKGGVTTWTAASGSRWSRRTIRRAGGVPSLKAAAAARNRKALAGDRVPVKRRRRHEGRGRMEPQGKWSGKRGYRRVGLIGPAD